MIIGATQIAVDVQEGFLSSAGRFRYHFPEFLVELYRVHWTNKRAAKLIFNHKTKTNPQGNVILNLIVRMQGRQD